MAAYGGMLMPNRIFFTTEHGKHGDHGGFPTPVLCLPLRVLRVLCG